MNLNFYHYVAVIAEDGNLSTASEHLFITQSALTQALKKMEQAFGGPLFTYQNRSMRPTPLGQIVLETAMEMEEARLQMTNAISQPETAAAGCPWRSMFRPVPCSWERCSPISTSATRT